MENLSKEYNSLRIQKALVIDALLETIENLKELKRNIDEDCDSFIFDYKFELNSVVKYREHIYRNLEFELQEADENQPVEPA